MKPRAFFRSAAVVSLSTALSRILGFVREVLMATVFGTSLAQSAFVVAFTIPNLFRRLFGEGALSAAFIPVFTETNEKQGREAAWKLATHMLSLLSGVLGIVVLIGLGAITLTLEVAELGPRATLILSLLRIMLPYMLFICVVALCMAILNAFKHFAVPAMTPVILNLVWIFTLAIICPLADDPITRVHIVAWGILIAGVLQLAAQFPVMRAYGFKARFDAAVHDPGVRRVLVLMGPAALGMGVHQINVLLDRLLAVMVADWAPAALSFSERLIYLPLGIIATALGTVLLPAFSSQIARERPQELLETLRRAMDSVSIIMVPAAVGLWVLAEPIVRLSFVWPGGAFDADSTWQTVRALQFYAPGLLVFSLYKLITPVFYAMQDTRTPVRVGLWAVVANFALNILFVFTWPEGYKHAGLACATVLSSLGSCIVLALLARRRAGSPGWAAAGALFLRCAISAALMAAVAAWVTHALMPAELNKLLEAAAVTLGMLCGAATYVAAMALLARSELRALIVGIRH